MPAPTANTNASKWTREKTIKTLQQIEAIATDEYSITHTLTQALMRLKCYKQLWSYWKKKWENDGDIMDQIYYIEQIFINKLEEGALFRQLHPSACYFILKHNYGYNTKGENELPSHLRAEFEEPQQQPHSGSKTTSSPAEKPVVVAKTALIQPPVTSPVSSHPSMYGSIKRQNDQIISVDPHQHRPIRAAVR
ncbi:MAG: hypothetical protein JST90_12815 [Bacteroidetes bacterium]|nr:hypothetical protein [Bacteroidota bacterium]